VDEELALDRYHQLGFPISLHRRESEPAQRERERKMEGPSEASIKERNEKIENLWKRSFEGRTMFNDLPRFAQTIQVFGGTGDQLLHAPKAGAGAVKNLKDLFTVLTHELEGAELAERVARTFDEEFKGPEDVQNKAHFVKYLTDIYGGEESRVVRLLQACNQSVPSPAIIELQKALITKSGQAGMTKDVKDSWIFHIHLPPPHAPGAAEPPKGRPGAVVRVEKREQHIMNMFQYQWQLLIHFDEAVQTVRSISLRVIDLMYHQNLHAALPLKQGLVAILSPYLAPNVAQLAETREWCVPRLAPSFPFLSLATVSLLFALRTRLVHTFGTHSFLCTHTPCLRREFFKMEGPTAAAAEEKSLLVINDADNADSDFESSRTDAKAKNPRREGSPLSNRSDSLHSTPLLSRSFLTAYQYTEQRQRATGSEQEEGDRDVPQRGPLRGDAEGTAAGR
jgi:hypothetical protein